MKKILLFSALLTIFLYGCQVDEKLDVNQAIPADLLAKYNNELAGMDQEAKEALIPILAEKDMQGNMPTELEIAEAGIRHLSDEEQAKMQELVGDNSTRECQGNYYNLCLITNRNGCNGNSRLAYIRQNNMSQYGLFYTRIYKFQNGAWRGPYNGSYGHNRGCPYWIKTWCLPRSNDKYAVIGYHWNGSQWRLVVNPNWYTGFPSYNYYWSFRHYPNSNSNGGGGCVTYY